MITQCTRYWSLLFLLEFSHSLKLCSIIFIIGVCWFPSYWPTKNLVSKCFFKYCSKPYIHIKYSWTAICHNTYSVWCNNTNFKLPLALLLYRNFLPLLSSEVLAALLIILSVQCNFQVFSSSQMEDNSLFSDLIHQPCLILYISAVYVCVTKVSG